MGRYVPPDQEGLVGASGNALHRGKANKHRLRHGAAGLVVRFEMPFAVWCATCPAPTLIGQGVRFNAEKRAAGRYHTTPVWSFRLRHPPCGGEIEMRTDPRNADFVVVSGARRRDLGSRGGAGGEDEEADSLVPDDLTGVGAGGFVIATERERAEQRETAFGRLEKTIADRERAEAAGRRIRELQDVADRHWDDPHAQNQRLRRAFRAGRHAREKEAARAEELKDRMSLGIELLPEAEEDARRAALVDYGSLDAGRDLGVEKALARPLFENGSASRVVRNEDGKASLAPGQRKLKSEIAASRTRENLVSEIVGNTRAARDPFLDFGSREGTPTKTATRLPGLKRKRVAEDAPDPPPSAPEEKDTPKAVAGSTSLVSYNSDSD